MPNTVNQFLFFTFFKSSRVSNPTIKVERNMIPNPKRGEEIPVAKIVSLIGYSLKSKRKAPNSTGILKTKENSSATYFSNPLNIPAIVVIPDLDVPGMRAMT